MNYTHTFGQLAWAALASALVLTATPAMALYKVVGADGKVTYTDRPPTDRPSQSLKTNGVASSTDSLPFELRQTAERFPVTLYTAPECEACDQGRQLLKNRGVPFVEKSVLTNSDAQALQRLEATTSVPVLRIGKQPLQGFSSNEWTSYLDAAGYPKQSALPRTYQYGAAAPLTTPPPSRAEAAASRAEEAKARAAASRANNNATADGAATPPGFRF